MIGKNILTVLIKNQKPTSHTTITSFQASGEGTVDFVKFMIHSFTIMAHSQEDIYIYLYRLSLDTNYLFD